MRILGWSERLAPAVLVLAIVTGVGIGYFHAQSYNHLDSHYWGPTLIGTVTKAEPTCTEPTQPFGPRYCYLLSTLEFSANGKNYTWTTDVGTSAFIGLRVHLRLSEDNRVTLEKHISPMTSSAITGLLGTFVGIVLYGLILGIGVGLDFISRAFWKWHNKPLLKPVRHNPR